MARPFAAPPGIPADRKAALIAAFNDTMKDPDFLAEAKKLDDRRRPGQRRRRSMKCVADAYAHPEGRHRQGRAAQSTDHIE